MSTLIWTDDFESYTGGSPIGSPWTNTGGTKIDTSVFKTGAKSLAVAVGGFASAPQRVLGSNVGQFYCDFWFQIDSAATGATNVGIRFLDASGGDNGLNLLTPVTGAISVVTGNGSIVITGTVSPDVWHHGFLEGLIASSGNVKLTIDGTVIGNYSGDTRATNGNSFVNAVQCFGQNIGPSPAAEVWIDDLFVYSGVPPLLSTTLTDVAATSQIGTALAETIVSRAGIPSTGLSGTFTFQIDSTVTAPDVAGTTQIGDVLIDAAERVAIPGADAATGGVGTVSFEVASQPITSRGAEQVGSFSFEITSQQSLTGVEGVGDVVSVIPEPGAIILTDPAIGGVGDLTSFVISSRPTLPSVVGVTIVGTAVPQFGFDPPIETVIGGVSGTLAVGTVVPDPGQLLVTDALSGQVGVPSFYITSQRLLASVIGLGIAGRALHQSPLPIEAVIDGVSGTTAVGNLRVLGGLRFESLWHPSRVTTSQGVTNGFYDVPHNLEANPNSHDVQTISRSTWAEHFTSIIANQPELVGNPRGSNNFRDTTRDLTLGTAILQHRAPLLKAMLLATDTSFDLTLALRFADQEYSRFRNKFTNKLVDLRNRGVLTDVDPVAVWVSTALTAIKRDKNTQFPFALNSIGNGQYFIPPTPTCLGVLPAAIPALVTDTTYPTPVLMILGHDGSFTPAFNDWRDPILLALEQTIYASLPTQWTGLNVEKRPVFDIQQWIATRFFDPYDGYTRDEVSNILAPLFELWAQQHHFDYRSNKGFDAGNPFTWNFRGVLDRDGNPLPGNWRAIYRWYYGTDAPHLRPYEMLGFVCEPSWWQTTYGAAPYSSGNTALWTDLETGTIRNGPRKGTDDSYARPGLSNIIPVDASGVLFDPVQAGIVLVQVTADTAARSWLPGDQGPVENLWQNSPSYRFALAMAAYLMKPARFVEECWDPLNIGYIGPQWVNLATMARPSNADLTVHGEGNATVIGISQWIADYLRSAGHTSDAFGAAVRGLDVRLIHQIAGFTSSDDMKVLAENFGLLPTEDVKTVLYMSPDTRSEVYSGVILEWTGRSWRCIGYDARNPVFTIIPPDPNGAKGIISLSTTVEPSIVEWRPNVYYPAGVLTEHLNSVWQCQRGHTSSPRFEQNFWSSRPDLSASMIPAPRVVNYFRGLPTTINIPYGTEFYNYQQVADFLLGWQRWLVSRGWIFDTTDADGQLLNWELSVREFLSWTQVKWSPGNFIALSPGQQQLKFSTAMGTILNVENSTNAFFGLSDRSGHPIGARDAIVNRLDGAIEIHAKNADIFCARLGFTEIEHALVFSNVTIFNDNIYLPLFDQRQARLRLNCKRSRDWTGRLDAPGFIVTGNQLRPNFEKATEDVRLMFDIELADRVDLRKYARHVVGFQARDYMQNLVIADVEQFEFYQGMIQQKGAPGVFRTLARSTFASNDSNLQFLEEWAVRRGEFGAPVDPFMAFQLGQTDTRNDPQLVRLIAMTAPLDWIVLTTTDPRWVDLPADPATFFTLGDYTAASLPTAGPVRVTDASVTAFRLIDVPNAYLTIQQAGVTPFPTGSSTWVYERPDASYTVLRSFDIGTVPNAILKVVTSAEDSLVTTTRIFLQQPITLTSNDVGNYLVIDGQSLSDPELQGLVTISAVNLVDNYVEVSAISNNGYDFTATLSNAPLVRVLREVRFATRSDLLMSGYAFATGDLVWIDNDLSSNHWAVLQYNIYGSWDLVRHQPRRPDPTTISETVIYNQGTRLVDQQMMIDEPIVDSVDVIDPLSNILAGIADRDIDYKTNYDPARYNASSNAAGDNTVTNVFSANPWGADQVGRVWWNLATVKFLDPFTDTLGESSDRDIAELTYRTRHWSAIAVGSSVDVYEWVESTVPPINYNGPGTVFNSGNPLYVEQSSFDTVRGKITTFYYFWVRGLTTTPNVPFRHTDVSTIALAIENPSGLDLAWMAPIDQNALIVSGVSQFLNDTTTVIKVRLTVDSRNPHRHAEWDLLRPFDDTSLPSAQLWTKLRDSLAGFDSALNPIPDPAIRARRAAGIRDQQSMFAVDGPGGVGTGLKAARQSFVGMVNTIFKSSVIMRDRLTQTSTLYRSTPIDQYLIWAQLDISYAFEPPPSNEWDVEVFALDQRNRLLARSDFEEALISLRKIRVLLNGFANPLKQWSIWEFDPVAANALIAAHPFERAQEVLVNNADTVFNLALAYEFSVADMAARDALTVTIGDRVLVINDVDFWAIWQYLPGDPTADYAGFVLWRTQTYRTADFIERIDWYASGYSPDNPPIVSYATITQRNVTEGTSPSNLFVKIENDGNGRWLWTQFDTNPDVREWNTVAVQSGTLALSSNFFASGRPVHGVNTLSLNDVATRDGSWELYVLVDALRYGGLLLNLEINGLFFSVLNFIHVQQDSVEWAFKTSFMTIVGYNVPLKQTPVLLSDQSASLISYINEVKPYHVKIRSSSTQYNSEVDIAHTQVIPDSAFDITLLFDRYTYEAWDIPAWDDDSWDSGDTAVTPWDVGGWDVDPWDNDLPTQYIYVHTVVTETLTENAPFIEVDDITYLRKVYIDDTLSYVSAISPLTIRINDNVYQIAAVVEDAINTSTTLDGAANIVGISGRLTTLRGTIAVADGTAGNVVEAIMVMPHAARRIFDHYQPTAGMPPNDLSVLLDLTRPTFATYTIIDNVLRGATTLPLNDTSNIFVGQPVHGPSIVRGTLVSAVTETTISLSMPIIDDIAAITLITIALPNWIAGVETPLDVPECEYDGGVEPLGTVDISLNPPSPSRLDGFGLREPYANGQPQERVPFNADDALHMTVTALDTGGTLQWMTNSRLSSAVRMPPARDISGAQISGTPTHGPFTVEPMYQVLDEYVVMSPFMAGTLANDLHPGDDTITLDLYLSPPTDPPTDPLTIPGAQPGSIWIGGERIEYFALSRSGDRGVTLSQLRRATHGSSIIEQRQVTSLVGNGSAQNHVFSGLGHVDVMVDGAPYAFTTEVISGDTSVDVTASVGAIIRIAMTSGYVVPSGSVAYNGDTLFSPPMPLRPLTVSGVSGHCHVGTVSLLMPPTRFGVSSHSHVGTGTVSLLMPPTLFGVSSHSHVGTVSF